MGLEVDFDIYGNDPEVTKIQEVPRLSDQGDCSKRFD